MCEIETFWGKLFWFSCHFRLIGLYYGILSLFLLELQGMAQLSLSSQCSQWYRVLLIQCMGFSRSSFFFISEASRTSICFFLYSKIQVGDSCGVFFDSLYWVLNYLLWWNHCSWSFIKFSDFICFGNFFPFAYTSCF